MPVYVQPGKHLLRMKIAVMIRVVRIGLAGLEKMNVLFQFVKRPLGGVNFSWCEVPLLAVSHRSQIVTTTIFLWHQF